MHAKTLDKAHVNIIIKNLKQPSLLLADIFMSHLEKVICFSLRKYKTIRTSFFILDHLSCN